MSAATAAQAAKMTSVVCLEDFGGSGSMSALYQQIIGLTVATCDP